MNTQPAIIDKNVVASQIWKHISKLSANNRLYSNCFNELSQNNFQNHLMDRLIETGLEALEVWSTTRNIPPINLLDEAVAVIVDIQTAASALRTPDISRTLSAEESHILKSISAMATGFNQEIDAFFNKQKMTSGNGYVSPFSQYPNKAEAENPRYKNIVSSANRYSHSQSTVPEERVQNTESSNVSVRYRQSSTTAESPKHTNATSNKQDGRLYVTKNKTGNLNMTDSETLVYQNHRKTTFKVSEVDRKPAPDFMGVLAHPEAIFVAEEKEDLTDVKIVSVNRSIIATCRKHAQAIAAGTIVDVGSDLDPNSVFEYAYEEVACLRTMTDEESMRLALLNDPRLVALADNDDNLTQMADELHAILTSSTSELVKVVCRRMNAVATEQINRLLRYDLDVEWQITDFQSDWSDLCVEMVGKYTTEQIDTIMKFCSADIIGKMQIAFTPDKEADEDYCVYLNNVFSSDIASRSVFVTEMIHVTHIPATMAYLNLSFEDGVSFVDPALTPELHAALEGLKERTKNNLRGFSKILLVTEDDVELEVIPTTLDSKCGTTHLYGIRYIGA